MMHKDKVDVKFKESEKKIKESVCDQRYVQNQRYLEAKRKEGTRRNKIKRTKRKL